ncbi:MAG: hypothetical protein Q8O56_00970 [Solirubrobacteraceae bacterium]|nr:hypothetical protein [Solirubrobacteraceae bacterium]
MSEQEQMIAGPTGNEATIAAIADVLAAIGSDGGAIEWADEEPVQSPAPGTPAAASGATISHGPIRLRDSAPPSPSDDHPAVEQEVDAAADEPVGHGAIRLREGDQAPLSSADVTPIARADILDAIAATES